MFTVPAGSCRLNVLAIDTGKGISVTITGGNVPHIGAVALAVAHPSPANPGRSSATVSTIQVAGHKDGFFAGPVAEQLSRQTGCTVTVTAGIHIGPPDEFKADPVEIQKIIESVPRVVEAILDRLRDRN